MFFITTTQNVLLSCKTTQIMSVHMKAGLSLTSNSCIADFRTPTLVRSAVYVLQLLKTFWKCAVAVPPPVQFVRVIAA